MKTIVVHGDPAHEIVTAALRRMIDKGRAVLPCVVVATWDGRAPGDPFVQFCIDKEGLLMLDVPEQGPPDLGAVADRIGLHESDLPEGCEARRTFQRSYPLDLSEQAASDSLRMLSEGLGVPSGVDLVVGEFDQR